MISFDVTADGFRAVPRTHLNLIAGGLAIFLESDVPQGATMMSAFAPSSFAGLTSSLLVWLLSGGTLALHHPFDGDVLEQQINERCLRYAGRAGATGVAAGRDRPAVAPADLAQCDRPVARAGTGRIVSPTWTSPTGDADRRLSVRRGRPVRRAPQREDGAPAADPAGTAWRAARGARARRSQAKSC